MNQYAAQISERLCRKRNKITIVKIMLQKVYEKQNKKTLFNNSRYLCSRDFQNQIIFLTINSKQLKLNEEE